METFLSSSPQAAGGHIIPAEEKHFWERMTLRQLAIFIIRLQGAWLLFDTVTYISYLPTYWHKFHSMMAASDPGYFYARRAYFLGTV